VDLATPPELACGTAGCPADAAEPAVDQARPAPPDVAPGRPAPDAAAPGADRAADLAVDVVPDAAGTPDLAVDAPEPQDATDDAHPAGDADPVRDATDDAQMDLTLPPPSADGSSDRPLDVPVMDLGTDLASDLAPDLLTTDAIVTDAPIKPNGAVCAVGSDCTSGICEDGVCCVTTCGQCRSCNLAGSAGTCAAIPAGGDSAGACPRDGVAVCGRDGTCDGNGACRFYPSGTVCRDPLCVFGNFTPPYTCDGSGACRASTPTACTPYTCASTTACRTSCSTNGDCVAPTICIASVCRQPKTSGQACAADAECLSGNCEQGVCCSSACAINCYSCNLPGTVGSCAPVPMGQDPLAHCPDLAANTCGTTGACNGTGGCVIWAQGTPCGDGATCTNGRARPAPTCNGASTCVTPPDVACVNHPCDAATNACKTTCANDGECVAPAKCVGGKCGGLKGDYFDGTDPAVAANLKFTRIDAQVNFNWDQPNSPDQALLGPDTFSVRWTGKVVPRFTETYTFITYSDDGVRVWVNGTQLINNWGNHGETRDTGTIALQADTAYDLTMELFQGAGGARARLLWSSASEPEQLIPQVRLTPAP
jgi:hypothetical protein